MTLLPARSQITLLHILDDTRGAGWRDVVFFLYIKNSPFAFYLGVHGYDRLPRSAFFTFLRSSKMAMWSGKRYQSLHQDRGELQVGEI